MDILLTHGYFLREDPMERIIMKPYPPLGILYLSSFLKRKGFDVSVFDSTFAGKADFDAHVTLHRPPVVGIYANLMTKLNVLDQIRRCKSLGCRVVVGGPDVAAYAEEYIAFGADVAVIGEGEETLAELLPVITAPERMKAVSGIAFRDEHGTIVVTPRRTLIADLDSLPFPDRDAIDIRRYVSTWKTHHGMGSLSLICARGCPFTCTWCSRSVFGESHRRRSVQNVVDEIELLRDQYGPDMLWFADDVFTINHKWFHDFHAEMKRRGIRMPFECISRADRLNEDILKKMAELGAFRIWYGSESGSQRILDAMKRRVGTEEIRTITHLAQRFGIQTGLFVMLGYPGEEFADIEETVSHLKAANADIVLTTMAYPIKGTDMYNELAGVITAPDEWSRTTDRQLRYPRRYSDRFYWFANRYVINEVQHNRLRNLPQSSLQATLRSYLKAKTAWLGMRLLKGT